MIKGTRLKSMRLRAVRQLGDAVITVRIFELCASVLEKLSRDFLTI